MPKIRMDEWKSELEKVLFKAGDEGITVRELSKKLNLGPLAIRKRLQGLRDAGRLIVGHKYTEAIDGTNRLVAVYRIGGKK